MSPFLRKVKTASGAVAVQIVEKGHGQRRIVGHLGSAHNEAELAALVEVTISRPTPYWYWGLGLLGLGMVATGLLLRRRAKRSARATEAAG